MPSVTMEELLQTTSRTFALSIPLLPAPLDHQITTSYLIFRISDTLEDADHLDRSDRQRGLLSFCELLDDLSDVAAHRWSSSWSRYAISDNEYYNRLIHETPQVIAAVREMETARRDAIVRHAKRSAQGMTEFLAKANEAANLSLSNLDDLRRYCYYVAGIVGELITELFTLDRNELAETAALREHAAAFGEGLQLVNILKDADADETCGRAYLPHDLPVDEVFELAFDDLAQADTYVDALREMQAPPGYIAFCDVPIQLARATLRVVREDGPGSKLPRDETFALIQDAIERAGPTQVNQ